MSRILALRDAVVSTLQGQVGTVLSPGRFYGATISAHDGEFDSVEELKRYAVRTPAIVVSIVKADAEPKGGLPRADVVLAAFVLTQDKPASTKGNQAVQWVDNLLDFMLRDFGQKWGVGASKPINCIGRNLYGQKFDQKGVALWGLFWQQSIDLEPPTAVVLPDAEQVHIDYQLLAPSDPEPEASDDVDLTA